MKKLSILLVLSLILSALTPVFAESELETIVTDVKSRIEIADYENFDSSYYERDGKRVYNLSWGNGSGEDFEYVEVLYSDGFIKSYTFSKSTKTDRENKFPKIDLDEALRNAEEFAARVNPLYKDKIKLINTDTASIGTRAYNFGLQRFEQGFPVKDETGDVRIDNETGEVTYYNMNFDTDAEFPVIGEPIGREDALSIYKKELAPKLQYAHYYDYKTKENKVFLEYVSNEQGKRINALTGEVIDLPTNFEVYEYGVMKENAAADATGSAGLSRAELDEIQKVAALISQDEAEKIARECRLVGLSDEDKLNYVHLNTYYTDSNRYYYTLSFAENDSYKSVGIDAKDGSIISFYKRGEYEQEYTHKAEEEAAKAEEVFKELAPSKKSEYRLSRNENGNVSYNRFVNDVEVSFDSANFGFDDKGELVNYNISYTENAEFPKPEGVLSSGEICDIMAREYDFTPMFAIDGAENKAVLFYTFLKDNHERTFTVEPYTAKPIDYKGEIREQDGYFKCEYADIGGHYAEAEIKKLCEYGIGFSGGRLMAKDAITQKELVELLGSVFNYSTDYPYILERLVNQNVIDKEVYAENEPLTRADASVIFIKMLGAEEYAKFNDIYVAPFKDVTENKGYIALLKALGVVNGDTDGNFYPEKLLTREEALIMIYNYLSR